MIGTTLLPPNSARVPVTFLLAEGTKENISIPTKTQVSAGATDEHPEMIFETEKNLLATPAKLQQVFSVNPNTDEIFDHTKNFTDGTEFQLFSGTNQQSHCLYLGHDDLFNLTAPVYIYLDFILISGASTGTNTLELDWEYWNEKQWVSLGTVESNAISSLQKSGRLVIKKFFEAEIMEKELLTNVSTRWIRARIKNDPAKIRSLTFPVIDTIRASVSPINPVRPDTGFHNDIPLDFSEITTKMQALEAAGLALKEALNANATSATLVHVSGLSDDDWISFNNGTDQVEIRCIKVQHDHNQISWTDPLKYKYPVESKIKLLTAIRAGENTDETVDVNIDAVDGFEIGNIIKIIQTADFEGALEEQTEIAVVDSDNNIITIKKANSESSFPKNSYVADDTITVIKQVYPFGQEPRINDTFYLASAEAFSSKGAVVEIGFECEDLISKFGTNIPVTRLSWEYWDGKGWPGLIVTDTTDKFKKSGGKIIFKCPKDIDKVEVFGEESYWIRVRLIDGDYGKAKYNITSTEVSIGKSKIHPPVIHNVFINYEYPAGQPLEYCYSTNNLTF